MKDQALLASLFRHADLFSRNAPMFSEEQLFAAARADLPGTSAADIARAVDSMLDAHYLNESWLYPGHYRTDRSLVWDAAFVSLLSRPSFTNPRVSRAEALDPDAHLRHPLDQPQRYSIVTAQPGEGLGDVMDRLGLTDHPDLRYAVHGNDPADIARFPIGTNNLISANDLVARAGKALKRTRKTDFVCSPADIVIVSDLAVRSPHRAYLLARAIETLAPGKAIIVTEPAVTPERERLSLNAAIRAGAVSDCPPRPRLRSIEFAVDARPALVSARDAFETVPEPGLPLAAMRACLNGGRQLVCPDPVMRATLNHACQAFALEPGQEPEAYTFSTFEPVPAGVCDVRTGAGMRDGMVLRVEAGDDGGQLRTGEVLDIMSLRPLERIVVCKNDRNRYVQLALTRLAEDGARLSVHWPRTLQVRQGEPLYLDIKGRGPQYGEIAFGSNGGFAFKTCDAHTQVMPSELPAVRAELAYATATGPVNSRPMTIVASTYAATGRGGFDAKPAFLLKSLLEDCPETRLLTEDAGQYLHNAGAVHREDLREWEAAP